MNLYLVQHGEAMSEEDDPERPLTERGRESVRRAARAVAAMGVTVSDVYHSGKRRAQQTAELMAEALRPPGGVRVLRGLAPNDDPAVAERAVRNVEAPAMVVGHLPQLSRLAALLVTGDPAREIVAFHMGGVVCVGRDERGSWRIEWALPPEAAV